ncbi:MAG: tetratricopeptide repeat protein [Pyrinomonadaceae bacterium]|nr:tetratricopeptide repeat protein [Pyrinomonadaceae bacterium]
MGDEKHPHLYEFGPFSLDTRERVLLRDGLPLQIKPKVYETLLALVSQSGHLIDKEELMKRVWPDVVVEENNLSGNIFALRRAFAEHQYIETVARRGYRFTADVKQVTIEDVKVADRSGVETEVLIKETISTHRQSIDSLAVLPFVNASADPEAEYLSDGIAESIINDLAQLSHLRVMARSTVFRYRGRENDPQEVGRELKVRAVLIGRVVQLRDRLSVRAELVDVADGAQLWGNQYQCDASDIFAIHEEISTEISTQLRLKLTGAERERLKKRYTENTKAFHSYLKGRYHLNKRTASGIGKAIEHFREAIEFDPTYALAYAELANSYTLLGSAAYDSPRSLEMMPKAKAAAVKALEIDESLAEAHTSLAFIKFRLDWDWVGAEKEFLRAIELNPGSATSHHWYGLYLTAMDRQAEAIHEIKRAQELDPLSLIVAAAAGRVYHFARQYDQALDEYRTTMQMDTNYGEAHFNLGLTYEQKGMYAEAIAELLEAITLSGNRAVMLAVLGHIYSTAGRQRESREVLTQLDGFSDQGYVSPLDKAIVYTGLGELDQAFEWFEKAYQANSGPLVYLKVDPIYDSLRSDPRFNDLLRRMNLAP